MWTDGLQDLAEQQGVSVLSLAHALQEAEQGKRRPPWIDAAKDDVLLAVLQLPLAQPTEEPFRPLILEQYHGRQRSDIDVLQSYWGRSLNLAVPDLADARLHDILLASREALLNALTHGCGGQSDQMAVFQVAFCALRHTFRVRVRDSGPGHNFDFTQHERIAESELVEGHRGILLIKHLASSVNLERHGASVIMSFD